MGVSLVVKALKFKDGRAFKLSIPGTVFYFLDGKKLQLHP